MDLVWRWYGLGLDFLSDYGGEFLFSVALDFYFYL